jgi:competence protein ComEA
VPPHERDPEPSDPPARPLPPITWRDRLADLVALAAGRPLAAAALVAAAVVAVVVLLPLAQRLSAEPSGQPVEALLPMAGATSSTSAPAVTADGATATSTPAGGAVGAAGEGVVVHAAGAVAEPGVYELPAGSRVDDLVQAAGGLAAEADGDRVNLALPLVDGERVYVPAVGEAAVPEAPGPSAGGGIGGGASDSTSSGSASGAPVDLNTADLAQLDELPGVGPVTAQAIVDHREQVGPFSSVDQLLDVQGIGEARLGQLRELVTV